MKNSHSLIALLISLAMLFSSCEAIGDIFKAGMWVGVIVVVLIVAVVLWLIGKVRK